MSAEMGKAGLQIAVFLIVISLGLLLIVRPGTAEHVITVATLFLGTVFLTAMIVVIRRSRR